MLFSSQLFFWYFLPAVLFCYYVAPAKARHLILTLFSYFFYGWANPAFALVMLGTTLLNFYFGLTIAKTSAAHNPRRRKLALVASVVVSLGALAFFKYFSRKPPAVS